MTKITKPQKENIVKGKIANALTSAAKNHIVATTDDIYDTNFLEYQDEINKRLTTEIEELHGDVETLEGRVDAIQDDVTALNKRVTTIEGDVTTLKSDVTTIKGDITNVQNDVTIINSKIPEEASSDNQLADKEYVLNLIHSTSSAFRGNWDTWNDVPTTDSEYPEDGEGNRTPRQGDYIVIVDASGYIGEDTGKTYVGSWRFVYEGEWTVSNKDGWKPEYQINEEPEVTVSFYSKFEGQTDDEAVFITSVKITKTNTLTAYPQLSYEEYADGGYWDTPITNLRNIVADDTRVTYIKPFSGGNNIDSVLMEICFENGWSNSPEYITTEEINNINN